MFTPLKHRLGSAVEQSSRADHTGRPRPSELLEHRRSRPNAGLSLRRQVDPVIDDDGRKNGRDGTKFLS